MTTRVALITGPPGVGKTAVAERIARQTGCAHVEEDGVYAMLPSLPRESSSSGEANQVILALCRHFLAAGRSVLLDGLLYFPEPADALINAIGIRAGCRLVASVETCLQRNRRRGPGGVELDPAEVTALYHVGHHTRFVAIDAERSLDDVANAVQRELEACGWTT